jgi:hypothetical protein
MNFSHGQFNWLLLEERNPHQNEAEAQHKILREYATLMGSRRLPSLDNS